MTKYILVFAVCLLSLYACDNNEDEIESLPLVAINSDTLVGEWKLVESKVSSGGQVSWSPVSQSYTIKFLADATFIKNDGNCERGTYRVVAHPEDEAKQMIELTYSCEVDQAIYPDNKSYWGVEALNDRYLVYHPTYKGPICTEGCSYKFKKQ